MENNKARKTVYTIDMVTENAKFPSKTIQNKSKSISEVNTHRGN